MTRAEKLIAEAKYRNPCDLSTDRRDPLDMSEHDLMRALADEIVNAKAVAFAEVVAWHDETCRVKTSEARDAETVDARALCLMAADHARFSADCIRGWRAA